MNKPKLKWVNWKIGESVDIDYTRNTYNPVTCTCITTLQNRQLL